MKKTNKEERESQIVSMKTRKFQEDKAEKRWWSQIKTSTPFKVEARLFGNWRELKWCPKISHHGTTPSPMYRVFSTCSLHEWHICKSNVHELYFPTAERKMKRLSSMHSPTVRKRAKMSNTETSLTWHVWFRQQNQKHVHLEQLDRSNPDNTCPSWGAWQASQTRNSSTCRGYHSQHWTTLVHA